jgi:predicted nucleic acid-binding protein
MHFLGTRVGWAGQDALWEFVRRDQLSIAEIAAAARDRTRALMEKYRDRPMGLADATLVALAEERGLRRVFTLDEDFRIYRLSGRRSFEVVP